MRSLICAAMTIATTIGLAQPALAHTPADAAGVRSSEVGIPGPRTCFWARGPHSSDPYINLAYPDSNVFYWAATFTIPEGAKLTLEGEYPYARYMSLASYDARGRPVESLADYLIEPSSAAGNAVNPFTPGSRRDSEERSYSVEIVSRAPETARLIGERDETSSGNVLHTPFYGPGQQAVLYRIYLPDDGATPGGNVSLPTPVLTTADGTVYSGADACDSLKADQPLAVTLDAVGIPAMQYRQLVQQEAQPVTWPAQNPAQWFIQLDRESLLGIYTGEINDDARRSEGGFYPNLDNNYIRTIVNRKHGPVFLLRGRAPTTPQTHGGDAVMGDGELRYWSICSNQGIANTRVNDCLFDEEIPLDSNGYYTVMVSRAEDRPRNARQECGIGWLPLAPDGDGVMDEDAGMVQIRHMLASSDFPFAVQRVELQSELEETMEAYHPTTAYLMRNQAETFFPCFAGLDD